MEPSPPVSTPVSNDPGEASSKAKQIRIPSAQASSFRKATDTTKNAVITRDNRKCWLCGVEWSPSLDVAHNVGASIPLGRLETWKRLGILPAAFYPAHVDNLILLCKNCHSGYDCDYPGWIIIPQNLDFFINFEEKNYAIRIAAATHGDRQRRALPEIDGTGILCQPYILEPDFMDGKLLNWADFPKPFLGCPQTLILKALATCLYPCEHVDKLDTHCNVVHIGVPATVTEKVQKLVTLWSRSGPEVVAGRSGQKRKHESKDDDDGQDDEKDEKDNGEDPEGKDSKNLWNSDSHHIGGNSGRDRSSCAAKDRPLRGADRGSRDSAESKNKCTNARKRPTTYEAPTTLEPSLTTNQFLHHDEQASHSNNGTVDPTTELPVSSPSSVKSRKSCCLSTEIELAKGLNNGTSYENLDGSGMRDKEKFVWGPEKTAADIMSIANGWRRAWELYEKRK